MCNNPRGKLSRNLFGNQLKDPVLYQDGVADPPHISAPKENEFITDSDFTYCERLLRVEYAKLLSSLGDSERTLGKKA